jgi:hypothetical protein
VVTDKLKAQEKIHANKMLFNNALREVHHDIEFELLSRIDASVTNAIAKASDEILATLIILGWQEKKGTLDIIFGDLFLHLLKKTNKMVWVVNTLSTNFSNTRKIHLFLPEYVHYERGFEPLLKKFRYLAKNLKSRIILYASAEGIENVLEILDERLSRSIEKSIHLNYNLSDFGKIQMAENHLMIVIRAREDTISHNKKYEKFSKLLLKKYADHKSVIIYPEIVP